MQQRPRVSTIPKFLKRLQLPYLFITGTSGGVDREINIWHFDFSDSHLHCESDGQFFLNIVTAFLECTAPWRKPKHTTVLTKQPPYYCTKRFTFYLMPKICIHSVSNKYNI